MAARYSESAYRLPTFEERQWTSDKTGEILTAREIEPSEVREFLRAIVGAHAVEGFGRDLAERIYKPENAAKQKKVAKQVVERQGGGIGPRRIVVRNEAGNIAHTLADGVAMHDDVGPLLPAWRRKVRALSARLPGFHAVSVWPPDESDGAYYRIDAATAPEYRRSGVALHTAFFALDSILRAQQDHPLADAPALSFVPNDTDTYSLRSYPFLMDASFIETGRTMPFAEKVVVREMRAPSTVDVHNRLSEKLANGIDSK